MVSKQNLPLVMVFLLSLLLFLFFLSSGVYPFAAIALHVVSLLVLWLWVLPRRWVLRLNKQRAVDAILIACLFVLALVTYLYKLEVVTPGIQGDELAIAVASERVLTSANFVPFLPFNYGHPTPLLYVTGLSITLLGRTVTAIRLPYVLFGALSVAVFYLLLRLFFNQNVSCAATLLLLFSYPLIIVSRLAYEVTPSLFFQILTALCLYQAWKRKTVRYYAAIGLSIGAGLYTYVGFRTFALVALLLCAVMLHKAKVALPEKLQRGAVLLIALFIATTPLVSYSLSHSRDLMARTNALSVFQQNLPPAEVGKELLGSITRLSHLFFFDGDPNLKNNPSGVSLFDKGTFVLWLAGLIILLRKKRSLFYLFLLFSLSPLVNDVFSLERIPEFHYYGLGHPNTLRIAGIVPLIYFSIASIWYGLEKIKLRIFVNSVSTEVMPFALYVVVLPIAALNWHQYYNQPFNAYTYKYNGAVVMNVVRTINNSRVKDVAVSPQFLQDDRLKYFVRKDVALRSFAPHGLTDAINGINANEMTVLAPGYDVQIFQPLYEYAQGQPISLQAQLLMSPDSRINAAVYTKIL